jgi:hypothetical protein
MWIIRLALNQSDVVTAVTSRQSTRVERTIIGKMASSGRGNGDKAIGVRDKSFARAVAELDGRTLSLDTFAKRKF